MLKDISPILADILARRGFAIEREVHDEMAFGNMLVEAVSPPIRVRISRDRGQVLADISYSAGNDWHAVDHLIEFVDPAIRWNQALPSADAMALALDKNYDQICNAIVTLTDNEAFAEFERMKFRRK